MAGFEKSLLDLRAGRSQTILAKRTSWFIMWCHGALVGESYFDHGKIQCFCDGSWSFSKNHLWNMIILHMDNRDPEVVIFFEMLDVDELLTSRKIELRLKNENRWYKANMRIICYGTRVRKHLGPNCSWSKSQARHFQWNAGSIAHTSVKKTAG